MTDLKGKVALVTGSSRGIGAAIAKAFSAHGALVAVNGRDRAAIADVGREIVRAGGRISEVACDVTRLSDIETMRDQIERELGPVDILVANAGGNPAPPGPLENTSEAGWHAAVDANLTA